MSKKEAVISNFDQARLQEVIDAMKAQSGKRQWSRGDELQHKLTASKVLAPTEVPPDVVTMNSIARVRDKESNQEGVYNLVFPSDSKPLEGRVSVLSSLGLALFGSRIGDVVEWETPKGVRLLEVIGIIYQPEAARHWTL
ncbi:MAG TPA: GreA/GreB family elongation factor [Candidatus Hydrogenedentes bacterium]|nr:GreA/GreB family elongation factor [Candidatus Hydrogenedentota bacterium]HQE81682.1 GreA/GreB family elongation factor [Candidatus Hydrogenedentota bacterium]HQH52511.1 GreA/GreB family elongation factor [Candidatus Hydrogenedentota bacterium]HQM48477.1 GreA/GreB family elongation factor [Candidatus Hydrogenedentota bacterium]